MKNSDLKKLDKSELIKLLLKHTAKPTQKNVIVNDYKPIPKPRKSVKQMVEDYEDNIILPPTQIRDNYKPVPLPRTKKTVLQKAIPLPRTKNTVLEKPVPLPRTKKTVTEKPVSSPRTKICVTKRAFKGYKNRLR